LKSRALFTVPPDWIPWIPGTTNAGLYASAAKSVIANAMKPTSANVHRTERIDLPPDGLGPARYAHAAVGRPHRGQKFPTTGVPHRGHGHPVGACGAATVGAPHRGQKRPSDIAPQRTHCMRARLRTPRYLILRSKIAESVPDMRGARARMHCSIARREDLYLAGRFRASPSDGRRVPANGGGRNGIR